MKHIFIIKINLLIFGMIMDINVLFVKHLNKIQKINYGNIYLIMNLILIIVVIFLFVMIVYLIMRSLMKIKKYCAQIVKNFL